MKRWSYMNRTKYGGAVSDVINCAGRSIIRLSPDCVLSPLWWEPCQHMSGQLAGDSSALPYLCTQIVSTANICVGNQYLQSSVNASVYQDLSPSSINSQSSQRHTEKLSFQSAKLHWYWYCHCIHRSGYNYSSLVCATIAIFLMKWSDKYRDPRSGWSKWLNPIGIGVFVSRYPAVSPQLELTIHYLLTAAHNPGGGQMVKHRPRRTRIVAWGWG